MEKWELLILKKTDTVKDAINVLNLEALGIVMVSDEDNHLLGTVTDGDVRRALIHNQTMNTPLVDVMHTNPIYAFGDGERVEIMAMMQENNILQLPILDKKERIIGIETLQGLLKRNRNDNPVILMAGGFGRRLRPLTHDTPKPLLNIGGKPILETILNQFIDCGFYNFFISVHYKADMVQDYFGDGGKWGVNIQYMIEEYPLGTAGALGLFPADMVNQPVILMNGDLLTKVNFENLLSFHQEHEKPAATMCVREYDFQVPYGVIKAEGHRVCNIIEKPTHKFFVNAGIYVINPIIFNDVNGDEYLDMTDLLKTKIQAGHNVNMFPIHEYWLDIGRMEEFEQGQSDLEELF